MFLFGNSSKSNSNNNENTVQMVLVVVVVALVLYYFVTCVRDNKRMNDVNNSNNVQSNNNNNNNVNMMPQNLGSMSDNFENGNVYENFEDHADVDVDADAGVADNQNVEASEGVENNEQEAPVAGNDQGANSLPAECYPKDVLYSGDLLPADANSTWAQNSPNGQGSLGDKNFLNAGFHVGVNTVGQTLRNANRQLRSDPPNPQVKVSPWNQTTIESDTNRKPMEIGA